MRPESSRRRSPGALFLVGTLCFSCAGPPVGVGEPATAWYGLEAVRPKPTPTPKPKPTPTPAATPTPQPTATPTAQPTPTPTATPTPQPTATPTPNATPTPTGSKTNGVSASGKLAVKDGQVVNPTAPEGIGISL